MCRWLCFYHCRSYVRWYVECSICKKKLSCFGFTCSSLNSVEQRLVLHLNTRMMTLTIQVAICAESNPAVCCDLGQEGRQQRQEFPRIPSNSSSVSSYVYVEFLAVGKQNVTFTLRDPTLHGADACEEGGVYDRITVLVNVKVGCRTFI